MYCTVPVWSVTVGRPGHPPPQRSRKLKTWFQLLISYLLAIVSSDTKEVFIGGTIDASECVLIQELHHLFDIIWMSNVAIIPFKVIELCILLTSLLNALQLRIVLNPIEKISWVELLQWHTMKLPIIPWIYLSIVNRMTVHEPIYTSDGSKFFHSKKIYERYLGSVVVVISMNHVLSLNNHGSIIMSSFTFICIYEILRYSRQYHIASSCYNHKTYGYKLLLLLYYCKKIIIGK